MDDTVNSPVFLSSVVQEFAGWPVISYGAGSCFEKIEQIKDFNSDNIRSWFFSDEARVQDKRTLCMLSHIFVDGGLFINRTEIGMQNPKLENSTKIILEKLTKGLDVVFFVRTISLKRGQSVISLPVLGAPPGHPLIRRSVEIIHDMILDGEKLESQRISNAIDVVILAILEKLTKGLDVVFFVRTISLKRGQSVISLPVLGAPPGHPLIRRSVEIIHDMILVREKLESQHDSNAIDVVIQAMKDVYNVSDLDLNAQRMFCKGVYYLSFDDTFTTKIAGSISEAAESALQNQRPKLPDKATWLLADKLHPDSTDKIPQSITKIYIQKNGRFMDYRKATGLKQAQESWTKMNPGYELQLFNLVTARDYLREYFNPIFLRAFDCLQPFAAKSDLFRYALLYREGGWYSDWKQICLKKNLLAEISNETDFYAAKDHGNQWSKTHKCIQPAFIGVTPKHPIMEQTIEVVLKNIQSRYYGQHCLDTTGPCAFGRAVINAEKKYRIKYDLKGKFEEVPPEKHGFFFNNNETIIRHKCDNCGAGTLQNWEHGNNYVQMWLQRREKDYYFCEDAAAIFG
eukprot:CAMPEP_0171418586 /NCGR_PEP_ID=MMETSP0880-20121228/41181_1 /TAXON_ID=67004 /ORGANISM="Thalassiosira weissflogii, Strain CCMP1336" /LENGTH=570 /DNA_ID=CAMNT_0011936859 /DNA_START=235 /DNA_END=1948 /DNA_ORIENTATION=+